MADKPAAATIKSKYGRLGAYQVQLGAFKRYESAPALWRRLRKSQSGLLRGMQHRIQRVNRGKQGALHTLRVGPLASTTAADALCDSLARRGVDCMVVEF